MKEVQSWQPAVSQHQATVQVHCSTMCPNTDCFLDSTFPIEWLRSRDASASQFSGKRNIERNESAGLMRRLSTGSESMWWLVSVHMDSDLIESSHCLLMLSNVLFHCLTDALFHCSILLGPNDKGVVDIPTPKLGLGG